jgi:hypothetical protein
MDCRLHRWKCLPWQAVIRRLAEAHCSKHRNPPTPEQLQFWFPECQTLAILIQLAREHPKLSQARQERRSPFSPALAADGAGFGAAPDTEDRREQEADRKYWLPLNADLDELRHRKRRS